MHSSILAYAPAHSDARNNATCGSWLVIVEAAIDIFRTRLFHEVTLEQVADASAIELSVIASLYPSVDALVVDVIDVWAERRVEELLPVARNEGAVAFLRGILLQNANEPGLIRLVMSTISSASVVDHPLASTRQAQWVKFHALVQRTLILDIIDGREPDTMDPAWGAEQLVAIFEGLQLQSMVRPHMNVLESFERATTRLRTGWATPYRPTVWHVNSPN